MKGTSSAPTEGTDGAEESGEATETAETIEAIEALDADGEKLFPVSSRCIVVQEAPTSAPMNKMNVLRMEQEFALLVSAKQKGENPRMKLFLDTANVRHVAEIAAWGVLDGVTTNPSLVAKEGKAFKATVLEMCKHVPCVSAQVTETDANGMIKQGEEYSSWNKHVVVKVPMTTEGLKALKRFRSKGIKTNTTLVFSVSQAILAAKAGANIISPFIGRLDDASEDGMGLIADIMEVWHRYDFDCEVLVASTRHPRHIVEAALLGAHICTVPYEVFAKLPMHPLTDVGLKKFLEDWKKTNQ